MMQDGFESEKKEDVLFAFFRFFRLDRIEPNRFDVVAYFVELLVEHVSAHLSDARSPRSADQLNAVAQRRPDCPVEILKLVRCEIEAKRVHDLAEALDHDVLRNVRIEYKYKKINNDLKRKKCRAGTSAEASPPSLPPRSRQANHDCNVGDCEK